MKTSWISKLAFLGFFAVTSLLCADENQEVAENVCRQAYTSISRIEEGKIFLKSNKLHFYEDKIYLEDIHGGAIAIPSIFSCENGLYLKGDGFNIFNQWKCSKCKKWNHNVDDPTHCRHCGKPRSS